jgi:hypothetical protein
MATSYRAVPKRTHTGDTGAECHGCTWSWDGEATYATAANAARSHTQQSGHTTHWSDQRSGGFTGCLRGLETK